MSFVILLINQLIDNYKIAWLFGALIGSINNYLGSKYLSFKKWIILEFTSSKKNLSKLIEIKNSFNNNFVKYLILNIWN